MDEVLAAVIRLYEMALYLILPRAEVGARISLWLSHLVSTLVAS